MLVAPASRLFSTNSLTAVPRFSTTCPEQIRWTDLRSMGLMALAGCGLGREEGRDRHGGAKREGRARPGPPFLDRGQPHQGREAPIPRGGTSRGPSRPTGLPGRGDGNQETSGGLGGRNSVRAGTRAGIRPAAGQRGPEPPVKRIGPPGPAPRAGPRSRLTPALLPPSGPGGPRRARLRTRRPQAPPPRNHWPPEKRARQSETNVQLA